MPVNAAAAAIATERAPYRPMRRFIPVLRY
jgi:hypothetical protein